MGSHILFYFFTLEFPNFLFSNIVFWNVADPLELVDYFGQWACFIFPLLLRTFYKKVWMLLKKMSFTMGWTCLPSVHPSLENHFELPRSSIYSPSKPSLRCALEHGLLLFICMHPQVCFFSFPQLLLYWFVFSLGFHSHSSCRKQHQGMPCLSPSCLGSRFGHGCLYRGSWTLGCCSYSWCNIIIIMLVSSLASP